LSEPTISSKELLHLDPAGEEVIVCLSRAISRTVEDAFLGRSLHSVVIRRMDPGSRRLGIDSDECSFGYVCKIVESLLQLRRRMAFHGISWLQDL
jgi:hypothetical protein